MSTEYASPAALRAQIQRSAPIRKYIERLSWAEHHSPPDYGVLHFKVGMEDDMLLRMMAGVLCAAYGYGIENPITVLLTNEDDEVSLYSMYNKGISSMCGGTLISITPIECVVPVDVYEKFLAGKSQAADAVNRACYTTSPGVRIYQGISHVYVEGRNKAEACVLEKLIDKGLQLLADYMESDSCSPFDSHLTGGYDTCSWVWHDFDDKTKILQHHQAIDLGRLDYEDYPRIEAEDAWTHDLDRHRVGRDCLLDIMERQKDLRSMTMAWEVQNIYSQNQLIRGGDNQVGGYMYQWYQPPNLSYVWPKDATGVEDGVIKAIAAQLKRKKYIGLTTNTGAPTRLTREVMGLLRNSPDELAEHGLKVVSPDNIATNSGEEHHVIDGLLVVRIGGK